MHKKAVYGLAVTRALREVHEERKLSREAVAEALDVTDLGLTRMEHGLEPLSAGSLILRIERWAISWVEKRVKRHLDEAGAEMR